MNAGISTAGWLHYIRLNITTQGEKKTMYSLNAYIVERSCNTDSKQTNTHKHTETHPPRCTVCQTTSPGGDTGPHVLVTTASGWLSQGWGGTKLHWSPTHTHTHTQTHTQIKGKSCFFSLFLNYLFMWKQFYLSITIRCKLHRRYYHHRKYAKPQLDCNFWCKIISTNQRQHQQLWWIYSWHIRCKAMKSFAYQTEKLSIFFHFWVTCFINIFI